MDFFVPDQIADEAYEFGLTKLAVKAKIRQAQRTGRLRTERCLFVHFGAMTESELKKIDSFDEFNDGWFLVEDKG